MMEHLGIQMGHTVHGLGDYLKDWSPKRGLLGPKLLLAIGCVKLGEKNCVQLPSVGEQSAN